NAWRISASISRIAGQPEYVGVTVTIIPESSATASRTIPSSTTLSTGTSGSFTESTIANSSSRGRTMALPTRPSIPSRDDRHLRQLVAKMVGVWSHAAATLHVAIGRQLQRRARYDIAHLRAPCLLERQRIDALATRRHGAIDVVGDEQLPRVAPQIVHGA